MNIITKIFIVLMVPVSVLSGAVFTTKALADRQYRQEARKAVALKLIAEADATAAGMVSQTLDATLSRVRTQNGDLADRLRVSQDDLASAERGLEAEKDTFRRQFATTESNHKGTQNLLAQANAEVEGLRAQLTDAQSDEDAARMNETSALTQLDETQAALAVSQATARVYLEQISVLRARLAEHETGSITASSVELPAVSTTDVEITARVTGVADGIASIDAGTVKGVRDGTVFYIFRGSEFVANLEILTVDDSEAAGRIYDTRDGYEPQVGDTVATKLD